MLARLSLSNPQINQIADTPINPAVYNNDGELYDEASLAINNGPESFNSSIEYDKLNKGKAININIIASVILQINSINVPWFKYLCEIGDLLLA